MPNKKTIFLTMILALMVFGGSTLSTAQTSKLYFTDWWTHRNGIVQDQMLLNLWNQLDEEGPIAVYETIRTNGCYWGGGAEYDLFWNYLGTRFSKERTYEMHDATTDGEFIYAIYTPPQNICRVVHFDMNWKNMGVLFDVPSTYRGGITYDPYTETLWITRGKRDIVVFQYDFEGNILFSFSTGHQNYGLAFDPADKTLWIFGSGGGYDQWTTTGALLKRGRIEGLENCEGLHGVEFNLAEMAIQVDIDIKPGSYPNSINLGSNGNVPVAIFSTADFDATTVDPLTITLAGATVRIKGKGDPQVNFDDVDGDGLMDIVVHVDTRTFVLSATDTEAILTGETFDGVKFEGVDTIRIVNE